jgi:putative ABC transport system permease protein
VAFTSGLIPFGPSYAFTSFRKARELLHVENYRVSYVLVKVEPGASIPAVVADLQRQLPADRIMTVKEAERRALTYIVRNTSIGISIGTSTLFGVLVGFIVVALTLFSAVVDRTKDFGTLKAIGATNGDLAKLLITQAVTVAVVGWLIGQTLVALVIRGISSAKLPLGLPYWLVPITLGSMILLCVSASTLALLRVRKVEPAMVFRG